MENEFKNQRGWPWALALLLMVLAFFSPALKETFIFRDAFCLFYPDKVVQTPYFRALEAVLWNPWEVLGSSYVGGLGTCWFYPLNVVYMFFSPPAAFRIFIVVHFVLAAVFVRMFVRGMGAGQAASACAAVSYALSGYVLSLNGSPDMLATAVWLPGSLWLLDGFLRRRSPTWLVLFGASIAMPFLSGRAESVVILGVCASAWIMIRDDHRGIREKSITLIKVMPAAAIITLGLVMIQFLPTLELARISSKGGGFPIEVATLWSFHPKRLLEFILPSPWGRFWPVENYAAWELAGWDNHYPWSLSHYMGIPILAGALVSLAKSSWRRRTLVGGPLLIVLFLSFGEHSFVYPLVHKLFPPLRVFRYPEKIMMLTALIIACSGAFGLDHIFRRFREGFSRRFLGLLAIITLIAVASGILIDCLTAADSGSRGDNVNMSIYHAVLVLACIAAIAAASRFKRPRPAVPLCFLALTFFDLSLANRWIIPYADPGIYHFEPAALSIMRDYSDKNGLGLFDEKGKPIPGSFRVMAEPVEPTDSTLVMIEGENDLERRRVWERHSLMPNSNFIYGIEEITGYTAAVTRDFDIFMRKSMSRKTLELFNTRFVVSPASGSALEGQDLPIAGTRYGYGFKVFELDRAFPRAYLIGGSERVDKAMDNLDLINSHDFRGAVVLENHPGLPSRSEETEFGLVPCDILRHSPHQVRVRAIAPSPAYLVLSDSFFPGWEACVDGKPAPIFKANFLVRAVWVPEGDHEVVFKYNPVMYRTGRAVSLCSALICIGIIGFDLYRGRKE
jgi:hypothetical protein